MPFPHCSNWQLASQPSPLTLFASSHCSPSIRQQRPSPQKSTRHPVQPSHGVVFPSSHSSPGSTMPFPHCSNWQPASQPSPFTLFASSHCSPSIRQRRPSPQKSTRHPVQPSHGVAFPSSHSSPGSRMPFPHCSNWQPAAQPSPFTLFASSQCSPSIRQRRPSPQKSTRHPVQPSHGVAFPSAPSSPGSLTPFPH